MQIKEVSDKFSLDRVVPYFQPIIDLSHNSVWRYECLARLVTDDQNIFLPSDFLYLVQRNNWIDQLTEVILQQSASYFRNLNTGWNINIDMQDIQSAELMRHISHIASECSDPSRIGVELSAAQAIADMNAAERLAQHCSELGICLFIDQCHQPAAQLTELLNLPLHGLKLSAARFRDLTGDEGTGAPLNGLLEAAEARQIMLIAEHIEDETTLLAIKQCGIGYAQGYYFSHPSAQVN